MALPALAGGGGGGGGGGRGGRGGAGAGAGGAGGAGGFGGAGGAGGRAGAGAGGAGGRGFVVDPAQQIQTALTNIQTALGAQPGDEWTVLSAKIQKVLEDQQKLAAGARNPLQGGGGRGGAAGGRAGAGGPGAATAPAPDASNPLAVARNDLSQAVAATTTTPDADLKAKLQAVRDNLKKGQDTLATDQEALKKVCSVRQEAILVTLGVLN